MPVVAIRLAIELAGRALSGDGFSLGSRFTDSTPSLEATALGIHFENGTAPLQSHEMGLWDVTAGNTLVADVTMPAGGAGTFSLGGFLYIALPIPVLLNAGDQYILDAYYPDPAGTVLDQIKDDWIDPWCCCMWPISTLSTR